MGDFIFLWLRGLVYMVAFVILMGVAFGAITAMLNFPHIVVPIVVLIILPIMLGYVLGGKS